MKKYILPLLLTLLLFPIFVSASNKETIELSKCVDGDTAEFIINNTVEKVRFLAINTQESVSTTSFNTFMGKVASFYTCVRLKLARNIKIEYDENANEEDKYGRKLGWIFIDDTLLQEDLVSKGFATVAYLYDDYKYTEQLQIAEEIAKESNFGIWNENNYIAKIYDLYQKIRKIFT